jgi:hypothetical protein
MSTAVTVLFSMPVGVKSKLLTFPTRGGHRCGRPESAAAAPPSAPTAAPLSAPAAGAAPSAGIVPRCSFQKRTAESPIQELLEVRPGYGSSLLGTLTRRDVFSNIRFSEKPLQPGSAARNGVLQTAT